MGRALTKKSAAKPPGQLPTVADGEKRVALHGVAQNEGRPFPAQDTDKYPFQLRRTEHYILNYQKIDVRRKESLLLAWLIAKKDARIIERLLGELFSREGRCKWCGEKLPPQGDELVGNADNPPGRPRLYHEGCDVLARNERRSIRNGVEKSREQAFKKLLKMKGNIRRL
jgi:hypothetical protein